MCFHEIWNDRSVVPQHRTVQNREAQSTFRKTCNTGLSEEDKHFESADTEQQVHSSVRCDGYTSGTFSPLNSFFGV